MFSKDTRTEDEKRVDELLNELRKIRAHGDIPPENPFNETVGGMIWRAREKKGITRAHLAKMTGISQNSLAKYEKAGEEGGQYPPIPKLALLCMELELDPRQVLKRTFHIDVVEGRIAPDLFAFDDFLRTLDVDKSALELAHSTVEGIARDLQSYQKRSQQHYIEKLTLERQVKKLTGERNKYLHALQKKNGPDLDDPSRSKKPKNNTEAVDAASTRPKKGKD